MIYDIVISYQTEIDLRGIFEYIAFELKSPENASGQLDRLEACILSCSIYSGWWYTSGYDYPCYVWWTRCGYAIKQIYKNKIIWKHQSEMVGAFFMPEEICFLCPFLRKEVSTVANRIMGITVEIGNFSNISWAGAESAPTFTIWGRKAPPYIINDGFKGKIPC